MEALTNFLVGIVVGLEIAGVIVMLAWYVERSRRQKKAEKQRRESQQEERCPIVPCCGNCAHSDLSFADEPCTYCVDLNEWSQREDE